MTKVNDLQSKKKTKSITAKTLINEKKTSTVHALPRNAFGSLRDTKT